jgi:hypothetical protein
LANEFTNVKGSFTLDFTGVSDAPPSKFVDEDGTYLFKITGIQKKESGSSEYPYLEFACEVVAPADHKGKTLNEICSLSPKALFRLRNLLMAVLNKDIPKAAVNLDLGKLKNREFTAEVVMEPGKKDPTKKFGKIVASYPASKFVTMGASTAVTGDDDAEDLASLDASAPSGGAGTLDEADIL